MFIFSYRGRGWAALIAFAVPVVLAGLMGKHILIGLSIGFMIAGAALFALGKHWRAKGRDDRLSGGTMPLWGLVIAVLGLLLLPGLFRLMRPEPTIQRRPNPTAIHHRPTSE